MASTSFECVIKPSKGLCEMLDRFEAVFEAQKRLRCPDCGEMMVKTFVEHDDGSGWFCGWLCGCKPPAEVVGP